MDTSQEEGLPVSPPRFALFAIFLLELPLLGQQLLKHVPQTGDTPRMLA